MPAINMIQGQPQAQKNDWGSILGQSLGEGIQGYYQQKQNASSAKSLVGQLGLDPLSSRKLSEALSHLQPNEQLQALKGLQEAQIMAQYQKQQMGPGAINLPGQANAPDSSTNLPGKGEKVVRTNIGQKPPPPFTPALKAMGDQIIAQNKMSAAEEKEMRAESKEARQAILGKGRAAENDLRTLGLMDRLVDSKKLSNPIISQMAGKVGLAGLLSPETQIFEKALGQFLPGMADIYGSRVTNQHEKIFLNTLPKLSQTDAGKKKLIQLLTLEAEANKIKAKEYKEILKENAGRVPHDWEDQLEERTASKLDDNYRQILDIVSSEQQAPKGNVMMISPDGRRGYVPESRIDEAKKKGYSPL